MKKTFIYNHDGYDYDAARESLISNHLDFEPGDTDWEPTENEIYDEIDEVQTMSWEDAELEMENFFGDRDLFVMTGYNGTWMGRMPSGAVMKGYDDIRKMWAHGDFVNVYDEGGKFVVENHHHDGTNHWELKKLTNKGIKFYEDYDGGDMQKLCETLFGKGYSVNVHFAKKVYGI